MNDHRSTTDDLRAALRSQESLAPDQEALRSVITARTGVARPETRRGRWLRPLAVAAAVVVAVTAVVLIGSDEPKPQQPPSAAMVISPVPPSGPVTGGGQATDEQSIHSTVGSEWSRTDGQTAGPSATDGQQVAPESRISSQAFGLIDEWQDVIDGRGEPPLLRPAVPWEQVGGWEKDLEQYHMAAVWAGNLDVSRLPDSIAGLADERATVQWPSGTTRSVALADPRAGAMSLSTFLRKKNIPCDCPDITLVDPELVTIETRYPNGPEFLPAWSFGISDSHVRLLWVAVNESEMIDGTALDRERDTGGERYTAHVEDDGSVTVSFTGGAPGSGSCTTQYSGSVVEDEWVVAVVVTQLIDPDRVMETCNALGYPRTISLRPSRPLGDRVLIDADRGYPLWDTDVH